MTEKSQYKTREEATVEIIDILQETNLTIFGLLSVLEEAQTRISTPLEMASYQGLKKKAAKGDLPYDVLLNWNH